MRTTWIRASLARIHRSPIFLPDWKRTAMNHLLVQDLRSARVSTSPLGGPALIVPGRFASETDREPSRTQPRKLRRASSASGYTPGMKTAVSIPDEVFAKVERLARRGRRSRSEVFSAALREYVARHAPDEVTEAMDRVCAAVTDDSDGFVATAAQRVLERTEW